MAAKMKQRSYLGEAITSNGERGPFYISGSHTMVITGVLGGATLSFYNKLPASNNPGSMTQAPTDADMTFTALPAPFEYRGAGGLPLFFNVSGASGTTNLNIAVFEIDP